MSSAFFPSADGEDVDGCHREARLSCKDYDRCNGTSNRKIKFPSVRRSLWDRTPLASAIPLTSKECLPAIKLHKASEWKKVQASGSISWDLACTATAGNTPEFNIGTGHGTIKEALVLEIHGASGASGGAPVTDLARNLACDNICPLSQVVSLKASVGASGGQVTVRAAAPSATVMLSPLPPKRVCDTLLAASLLEALQQSRRVPPTDQHFPCASMQHGVLTLNQRRSLIPLRAAEAQAEGVPVVGLWLSGVRSVRDPHVWAACIRFLLSAQFPDKAIQPDLAFLLLVYAPGEGSYPACYEAKVASDGQHLPLATFCIRARPALQTGCASISLDLANAAKASIPVHTGSLSKTSRAHYKAGSAFRSSERVPAQLLQRTQGDACRHSSGESEAPQPRSPCRELPHSAERCHLREPQQIAADAHCSVRCSNEAVGSEAEHADVAKPQEQDSTGQQSAPAGPPDIVLQCTHFHAAAPVPLPAVGGLQSHPDEGSSDGMSQHSNLLLEERVPEEQGCTSGVSFGEKADTAEHQASLEDPLSRSADMRASESDLEGPATPACDVHKAPVAAPKQLLSSPDAAMLQRQVDLLKEQLEMLRVQLQAQGHGSAAPAVASPRRTALHPQDVCSETDLPAKSLRAEACADGVVPSGPQTDQSHATVPERSGIPASWSGAQNGSSAASTPAACSRRSSFSAQSLSDVAAAAAMFAAYARRPPTEKAAPIIALPLPADAAAVDRDAEEGMYRAAARGGSMAADWQEGASMPFRHPAEGQAASLQCSLAGRTPSEALLEGLTDRREVAAEHLTSQRERQHSGHAVHSPGLVSEPFSAAASDSDGVEDMVPFLLECAAASTRHMAEVGLPHISNPYRTPPLMYQHAVIRAIDPDLGFFSDSEDETEMARLERKYQIAPSLPDLRKPYNVTSTTVSKGVLQTPQCSSWPDASCHLSLRDR